MSSSNPEDSPLARSASCDLLHSPSSLNTLVISLQGMKERCFRNQRQIQELEAENKRLSNRHRKNESDLRKIREEKETLVKQTEELNKVLNDKNSEVETLQQKIHQLASETLYNSDHSIRKRQRSEEEAQTDFKYAGLDSDDDSVEDLDDILGNFFAQSKMNNLKEELLEQQDMLKTWIKKLENPNPIQNVEDEESASSYSEEEIYRICPMCEAQFPIKTFNQDHFEGHVLEHFQRDEEEARTLTADQYDWLTDAPF